MKWQKRGVVFVPDGTIPWMQTHASIPVADLIDAETLRIYFGTRDAVGKSQLGYVDTKADAPSKVLAISQTPVLPLGEPGTFDDSGIMPAWIVRHGAFRFLYYIGWNPQITVSYRLYIGLAVSEDGGKTFTKYSQGPVRDRSRVEPFFNTAPCVLVEDGLWRMWYISCTGWRRIAGRMEPLYHIKYTESPDGMRWDKPGRICIDYDEFGQAFGRPCVFRTNGGYRMLYSYRRASDYRTDRNSSYRLGYAESPDGIDWVRIDSQVGITKSDEGWDSQMIEYCFVHGLQGDTQYLFYNGNNFGGTGFGYAVNDGDDA